MALGTHPGPSWTIAHLSDTHLLADGELLHGEIDTVAMLERTIDRIAEASGHVDALVVSGDIADRGDAAAYAVARRILDAAAARLGARLVVAAGNHDERGPFRAALLQDGRAPLAPIDAVHEIDGLRIVVLDTSLPGWHHGGFEEGQAEWLAASLREPAPAGTLLVMHHPPIPYRAEVMQLLEFRDLARLEAVLVGSDVRAVLSGHLHINGSGTVAGIPVLLASATSYADDLGAPIDRFVGVDAQQSCNLIDVYDDTITHGVIGVERGRQVSELDSDMTERLRALALEERLRRFSQKPEPGA